MSSCGAAIIRPFNYTKENVRGCKKRSIFSTNLRNDEYSIHKILVIVPDRDNWDSIQLNPHPPDSFYFSFIEKVDIEINLPELLRKFAVDSKQPTCTLDEPRTQVWIPSRLMHRNRIEYRLLLFVQNIKVNLGGELFALVCLIGCVAGCNKPNETFEVCCSDSLMSDLWKLRVLSRLLADLLWLPSDLTAAAAAASCCTPALSHPHKVISTDTHCCHLLPYEHKTYIQDGIFKCRNFGH